MNAEARNETIEHIFNLYQSVNGRKPSHINFDDLSDVELEQMADTLEEDLESMDGGALNDFDDEPDFDEALEWEDFGECWD